MKTVEYVEGIDITLLGEDDQSGMEPGAFIGQRTSINGNIMVVVDNSYLTWTLRRLTWFEWFKDLLKKLASNSTVFCRTRRFEK